MASTLRLTLLCALLVGAAPAWAQTPFTSPVIVPVGSTCTFTWSLTAFRLYLSPSPSGAATKFGTVPVTSTPGSWTTPCPTTPGTYYVTLAAINAEGLEGTRSPLTAFIVVSPLVVGATVQTTTLLNVRQTPGGTLAGAPQPAGARGVLLEGPTLVGTTAWWRVDYATGTDGWSSEPYLVIVP